MEWSAAHQYTRDTTLHVRSSWIRVLCPAFKPLALKPHSLKPQAFKPQFVTRLSEALNMVMCSITTPLIPRVSLDDCKGSILNEFLVYLAFENM